MLPLKPVITPTPDDVAAGRAARKAERAQAKVDAAQHRAMAPARRAAEAVAYRAREAVRAAAAKVKRDAWLKARPERARQAAEARAKYLAFLAHPDRNRERALALTLKFDTATRNSVLVSRHGPVSVFRTRIVLTTDGVSREATPAEVMAVEWLFERDGYGRRV